MHNARPWSPGPCDSRDDCAKSHTQSAKSAQHKDQGSCFAQTSSSCTKQHLLRHISSVLPASARKQYASARTQYWRMKMACTSLSMFEYHHCTSIFKYHHSMQSNGIDPACRVGAALNFAAMKIGFHLLVCALHRSSPEHQPQGQQSDEVIDYHGRSPTSNIYRSTILVWITTCVDVIRKSSALEDALMSLI